MTDDRQERVWQGPRRLRTNPYNPVFIVQLYLLQQALSFFFTPHSTLSLQYVSSWKNLVANDHFLQMYFLALQIGWFLVWRYSWHMLLSFMGRCISAVTHAWHLGHLFSSTTQNDKVKQMINGYQKLSVWYQPGTTCTRGCHSKYLSTQAETPSLQWPV